MELKNYYRVIFTNNQEFVIESEMEQRDAFISNLREIGTYTGLITLRLKEAEPISFFANQLFSVQKLDKGVIGHQTRLWRFVP